MPLPGQDLNARLFSDLAKRDKARALHINTKPGFIVRLEMHGVDNSGYNRIHEELAKQGVVVNIYDSKGVAFKLLPTTLHRASTEGLTASSVHEMVKKAIDDALDSEQKSKMTKAPSILVIKTDDLAWSGLDEVGA